MPYHVENIVDDLKGDPQVKAITVRFIHDGGFCPGEIGADFAAGLEKRRRFALYDFHVIVQRHRAVAVENSLKDFAFGQ